MKKLWLLLFLWWALPCFAGRGFNGTNQGILGSGCCFNAPTAAVTLSAWVKITAIGTYQTVSEYKNDQFPGFYMVGLAVNATGHPRGWINASGTVVDIFGSVMSTNVWYHLAVAFSPASAVMRLYVNGVQVGTTPDTGGGQAVAFPLGVGAGYNGACCDDFLSGTIAESATWSVELTPTEISALAHGSPPSLVRPAQSGGATLFTYWPMHGLNSTIEGNFALPFGGNTNLGNVIGTPPQTPHCPCGMPTGEGH
jgi:hypothetical protein